MHQEEPPQHAMQILGHHHQQQQQQQDDNLLGQQQQQGQDVQGLHELPDGLAGLQLQQQREVAGIAQWEADMQSRKVVGIYRGQGRLAGHGFSNPSWVEGRLWVYEDGSCGFVFMAEPLRCYLVDLQRLDGDL
jgi:hypothetical protein